MAALALFAFSQRNNAEEARATSDANAAAAQDNEAQVYSLFLATNAQLLNTGDPELALALALEANRIASPPPLAQRILAEAAYAPGARRIFDIADVPYHASNTEGDDTTLRLSPDGTMALVIYGGAAYAGKYSGVSGVILWDLVHDQELVRRSAFLAAFWLPNSQEILLLGPSRSQIWNITNDTLDAELPPVRFSGDQDTYSVSPDGKTLIMLNDRQLGVIVWDIETWYCTK